MYILLLIVLLLGFAWVAALGLKRHRRGLVTTGLLGIAAAAAFFSTLSYWGEMLWFESLGYSGRFWGEIHTRIGLALGFGLLSGLWALVTGWLGQRRLLKSTVVVSALVGAVWGFNNWILFLRYRHAVHVGETDPILGCDAGFYLFSLPFYDSLFWLLISLTLLQLVVLLASGWRQVSGKSPAARMGSLIRQGFSWCRFQKGVLLAVTAWGLYLCRFHLLYSEWGAVSGPGWVDVHLRLPAFTASAVLTGLVGLWLMITAWRSGAAVGDQGDQVTAGTVRVLAGLAALLLLGLLALPGLLQALLVEPNEITYERPYIRHNIEFTRRAFALDRAEEREFPVSGEFSSEVVANNRNLLDEVRLWDWRALKAVHKQFQEIRLYYEFNDVDIDRYLIQGRYRQVMISAREMEVENLPPQSQTFVNQRFKYTHGYGLTMTPVSEFSPQGLPNFLVQNIPPVSNVPELSVSQPEIYYGELTQSPAYVNTSEEEFDYPQGDQNVYLRYPGRGGVELTGLWRKFVFGWKFDGTKFFVSSYPGRGSRVMFHRAVRARVQTLAPFLQFDDDPYCVLVDGRLYWIIDAFSSSRYYPYSEPFSSFEQISYGDGSGSRELRGFVSPELNRANYVRNSVKAVVDAFHGTVDFYVFEPDDPVIRVWQASFPDLFKPAEEMDAGLRAHVRYPVDLLMVQGLMYAKYHMSDPEVFYNQEDLWVRATEKYLSAVQPVEPYYVMWELPDSDRVQFVLIQPFTPKNRQVMIGWMAGLCDAENYGRLLVYKFPKEKRILGPQQVETKIDQDRFLSGQLTLWDQRGSRVIRGNVLAIPIQDTLLYVEPIYLQAETAAYPELRLVAVMHGDQLSYANDLEQALQGLFQPTLPILQQAAAEPSESLARQAQRAFRDHLSLQAEGRFQEAAQELERLQQLLEQMAQQ